MHITWYHHMEARQHLDYAKLGSPIENAHFEQLLEQNHTVIPQHQCQI
jgi:hypothetical protein